MDSATIGAVFSGVAGVIIAIGAVIKIVVGRPRLPVAEEILEQLDEMRDDLLNVARWAHRAVAQAALEGITLEEPPAVLQSAGHRKGERRSWDNTHGWRSAVRAQTDEPPSPRPRDPRPATQPERRAVRPPVPPREDV